LATSFSAGLSSINSLTVNNSIDLARNVGGIIQFNEISQSPFYEYTIVDSEGIYIQHVVWFIDARSINALLNLAMEFQLQGIYLDITVY
jgi:spore germination protein